MYSKRLPSNSVNFNGDNPILSFFKTLRLNLNTLFLTQQAIMASASQGSSPKKLKHTEDALSEDHVVPTSAATFGSTSDVPLGSPVSEGSNGLIDDDCDSSYYGDILSDLDENPYHNETLSLQAQFDAVDLPPGLEVTIPWLEKPSQTQNATSSSAISNQLICDSDKEKKEKVDVWLQQPSGSLIKSVATSNSVCSEENDEDDVLKNFRLFKQFDTVQDFSDHHFMGGDSKPKQAPQKWIKIIQQEWKILEKDLPDEIFVRVCEERMDLLRAVIVGAPGTPYHDGLFFFDLFFPPDYPSIPPQVYYYSGGLRLNPNLYNCGKVCLSLLNTWHGKQDEQWTPGKSTVLQVLLSIQALVLNEKPYFNEPGYENMAGLKEGEMRSKSYNEDTFISSCKTMLYTLRRPPKHYEHFVAGHFRVRAHIILMACKAYTEGAEVGDSSEETAGDPSNKGKSASQKLKEEVSKILPRLVQAFTRNGSKDCEQFLPAQS